MTREEKRIVQLEKALDRLQGEVVRALGVINPRRKLGKAVMDARATLQQDQG